MTSIDALLFLAGLPRVPEFLRDRWIIGLPGWRFYIGRDWYYGAGIAMSWVWRTRAYKREGEIGYHFNLVIRFGRTRESVIDFGGPCWCPWPVTRQICYPSFSYDDFHSSRWTGRTYGWVGVDWPKLSFYFYRIPEDSR